MTRTVKNEDEQLLGELARRNWIILAVLILLSLFWRSMPISLGVLAGGLVAICGYHWLHHSLVKLLATPSSTSAKGYKFTYIVRLGALAATLVLLIVKAEVNPIGLVVGLSVVVINIFWATIKRSF